jgi:pyridoxal phosphate enzyme (YggS family)
MTVAEGIEQIRDRMEKACLRCGRSTGEIRLMGVSKFHEQAKVEEALKAGLDLFGENKVQEAVKKFTTLKTPEGETVSPEQSGTFELHLIGSLQRNKARAAAAFFDCIESLDRDELIESLGVQCAERKEPLKVLLELHTGEDSKSGYPGIDPLFGAVEKVLLYPGLRLCGLMTMAPFTGDEKPIRLSFRTLVSAREKIRARFPEADLSCLSMGMSNDFETAIEEGSTLIRVGTAIFGGRQ